MIGQSPGCAANPTSRPLAGEREPLETVALGGGRLAPGDRTKPVEVDAGAAETTLDVDAVRRHVCEEWGIPVEDDRGFERIESMVARTGLDDWLRSARSADFSTPGLETRSPTP